ncbi:MAG: DUF3343 domain-containing protein [Chloroflexota bacterium]
MPLFGKKDRKPAFDGIIIFLDVHEAMKAEKTLREADYEVKLVAPPRHLRKGCDLALQVNLVEQAGIARALDQNDIGYVEITPLSEASSELLQVVRTTDFGKWLMVKAGNMKLTFEKETGRIVNTSGGGCPDIPYLHSIMIGKTITEAPSPRREGYTLCAVMLNRALEESHKIAERGSLP